MNFKFLLSLLCAGALTASAQGYKDGIEYYKADQYANAKTILERTLNDGSTDKAASYYYLGQIELKNGNVNGAKAAFDNGVAANPDNGLNYVGLGAVALKNGDVKGAKSQFDAAKSKGKKNPEVLVAIARAYYNADPVAYANEVDKFMKDAFKADKQHPAYFIMQGDMLLDKDQVGDAAASYETAMLYEPTSAEAYVKYANAYIKVNPDFAINKLQELNAQAPNSALAQRELAEKYYDNDQWTRAAEQYGKYIENPNHFKEDEERYVVLLYFGKNYQQSYDLATSILAQDPNSFLMKRMIFLNKADMEQYAEAKELAQKFFASETSGNVRFTANDYTTYSDVLTKLGEDSLALVQIEEAVKLNPEKLDLLKKLSSGYNRIGRNKEAADAYQRFVDAGDYKTNDLFVLSRRYMALANSEEPGSEAKQAAIDKALENVNIVLSRVPDDYRIPQLKAQIYRVANDNKPNADSTDAYMQVLSLLDSDAANAQKRLSDYNEAYTFVASYYLSQGDSEKAKVYYNKMLELNPDNDALRTYIENLK